MTTNNFVKNNPKLKSKGFVSCKISFMEFDLKKNSDLKPVWHLV